MASPPSSARSIFGRMKSSLLRPMHRAEELPDTVSEIPVDAGADLAEHLVVMVNGLNGGPQDWKYGREQFIKRFPDQVFVYRSQCNVAKQTNDGIDVMGERLAAEVQSVVKERKNLRKISFVAHSLGGLIARYAIGILYEPATGNDNGSKGFGGTIAGLTPVNFITTASPHLGSRGRNQLPSLLGVPILETVAVFTAHIFAGRTGRHLYLTDNGDENLPLLVRMAHDCDEAKFISALRSFKRRVAYANIDYDHMVGWRTSSIQRQHELPKRPLRPYDQKYPHILYYNVDNGSEVQRNSGSYNNSMLANDLEELMIRGLTEVAWERVGVCFHGTRMKLSAHETIQVRDHAKHSDGEDVICHLIDHFHL